MTAMTVPASTTTVPRSRSSSSQPVTLRVASWNLRYDSQPDTITVSQTIASLPDPLAAPVSYYNNTGEQPWSIRRIHVAAELEEADLDVIGFQEALVRQVNDLQELLGAEWGWVGVGRDDGNQAGEFGPIFYKKSVLTVLSWDTFWLSETPFMVSKYPGAGSFRICTTVKFQSVASPNTTFTMFNTHLDDQSDAQRKLGASLILHRAEYEAIKTAGVVFITGDFNSPQSGTDSSAYQVMVGQTAPDELPSNFTSAYPVPSTAPNFVMIDTKSQTPRVNVSGHYATYTGFSAPANTTSYTRIDFLFAGLNGGWQSTLYKVGSSLYDDGVWASDHRPVFNQLVIG